ncbi:hypothetical protein [Mesorhizobium sp.]|uniref:hypothetical protein n=1 Tax=Mesorhizobium sp. TaxID=1871066 RepID=UPI000FEA05F8|nr:hypothetical protein [Mesorhizobium sp.]RWE44223.1 MAG: hypothetical protein EOS80_19990 [Mesorhizobium sp.]
MSREAILALLEQHVRLGEHHIARQREIIADFRMKGLPVELAETLLGLFEEMQILHLAHRDRVLNKIP